MNDVTEEYPPRAARLSVKAPINLRAPTLSEWTQGWTINISRSGVLFRADRRLEPNTALEMMLDIPTVIATSAPGNALRRGRVVRATAPSPLEDRPVVAAAFVDFQHTPPLDPRRI